MAKTKKQQAEAVFRQLEGNTQCDWCEEWFYVHSPHLFYCSLTCAEAAFAAEKLESQRAFLREIQKSRR